MIPDRWYAVLESEALRRKPLALERMGERLVLWRTKTGEPVCMRDRCPHRGAALSLGRVVDDQIACPYHGFRYDRSGACTLMPCEGRDARIPRGMQVPTYPVREAHGLIWLWWGEPRSALPELPWFDELPEDRSCSYGTSVSWAVNYARFMETNLDMHHFPFVHRSIGGFATGPRLDPFEVKVDGDLIRAEGLLRKDDGTPPERARGFRFRLWVRMPNLLQIELRPKLRLFAVSTPIDDEHTWIYGRYYQDYLRLPVLGRLLAWFALFVEWKIVQNRQDLPIQMSLDPRHTGVGVNRFVAADRGCAAYVRLREQLLEEARHRRAARTA